MVPVLVVLVLASAPPSKAAPRSSKTRPAPTSEPRSTPGPEVEVPPAEPPSTSAQPAPAPATKAAPTSGTLTLAAPGFTSTQVDPKTVAFFNEHLSQQLNLRGLRVTSAGEIQALLGAERQKQLLGCADDESTSCLMELADGLGTDGLVTGSVAKFGEVLTFNVNIIRSRDGKKLVGYTAQLKSEAEALQWLSTVAEKATWELVPSSRKSPRDYAWISAIASGASLALGTGAYLGARSIHGALTERTAQFTNQQELRDRVSFGKTLETSAYVLAGVAALGAVTTGALLFWPNAPPSELRMSAIAAPDAAGLVLMGTWP